MKNGRLIRSMIMGVGTTTVAAVIIGTAVLEKLNENEKSKFKRVKNTVGFYAMCYAVGFALGTIIEIDENQIRLMEAIQNSVSKIEA